MMGILFRRTLRLGPLRLNFTQRGLSSWSVKIGLKGRTPRVDLPGPFAWKKDRRQHGKRHR